MTTKFTRQEVAEREGSDRAIFIIDNVVYDATPFLEDHPGGHEVLLQNAGKDASDCFHEVGHSDEAREMREQYAVGQVTEEERWPVRKRETGHWGGGAQPLTLAGLVSVAAPPLAFAVIALLLYQYLF